MNTFVLTLLGVLFGTQVYAQANQVNEIEAKPNEITTYSNNLNTGRIIEDLTWASRGSVACFPGTQNKKFTGKHVLHKITIPSEAQVTITVIPDDKNANMSIYGYQVGTTNNSIVPNLSSCTSCEADHKWDYPKKGKTQDHTRSIYFNSIRNPYNIFIGVAGADGLKEGGYTLKIDLKAKVKVTRAQEKLKIYRAPAKENGAVAYKGNLAEGAILNDLSWASRSSVACFPGTQNSKFTGKHVHYVTAIPKQSKMLITVIPDDEKANMSIYAYMIGGDKTITPLELNSCVTCEAEHKWDYPKKGKTQNHTRSVYLNSVSRGYKVVIGVAGAEGLSEGTFKIQIETKPK